MVKRANRQSLPISNVNLREMRFTQLQQPMYFDSHRLAERVQRGTFALQTNFRRVFAGQRGDDEGDPLTCPTSVSKEHGFLRLVSRAGSAVSS